MLFHWIRHFFNYQNNCHLLTFASVWVV